MLREAKGLFIRLMLQCGRTRAFSCRAAADLQNLFEQNPRDFTTTFAASTTCVFMLLYTYSYICVKLTVAECSNAYILFIYLFTEHF